jgi:adenylate cyclase
MAISDRTRLVLPLIIRITLVAAVAGAVYSQLTTTAPGGAGFRGFERGLVSGALIGAVLTWVNAMVLEAPIGEGLRGTPFLVHIALKSLFYLVVFVVANALSQWLFPLPTAPGLHIGLGDILFFFAVSFVISFLLDLNRLLGQSVLLSFATGRYFRPRVEERIFLIIDMKGSTAAAERLGEVDFHRLLNRFIGAISGPIVLSKGEIHKYVGDELIATWPLQSGLKDARCLGACFGAMRRLGELRPSFEREFGFGVEFRAGLHCGPVVVGEIGAIKKEIALSGDALNTAARIVDACRERGETVLASAALMRQLTLPPELAARPLPPIELRGKRSAVELFVLKESASTERAAATPAVRTEGAVVRES